VVYHYCSVADTWSTYIFDGRDHAKSDGRDHAKSDTVDPLQVDLHEGMVPVRGREGSFGLYYDGEHYEYLTLPE
jgi:hypothetical protein